MLWSYIFLGHREDVFVALLGEISVAGYLELLVVDELFECERPVVLE